MSPSTPNDTRPMNTDRFLVLLIDHIRDDHDRVAAVRDWIEGDWNAALDGIPSSAIKAESGAYHGAAEADTGIAAQVATLNAFEALGLCPADHAEEADRIEAALVASLDRAKGMVLTPDPGETPEP